MLFTSLPLSQLNAFNSRTNGVTFNCSHKNMVGCHVQCCQCVIVSGRDGQVHGHSKMFLIFCGAIISAFLATAVGLVIYGRWNYGILESLNIPVVKRSFLLGSTPDLHKTVAHFEDVKRFKKYGPIYGVYEGRTPQIHVCDPELVRLIFIKDFDHFHDRREFDLGDPILNEMMDFIDGEKWKTVRHGLTPAFTTSKIKNMVKTTRDVVLEFSGRLESKIKDQFRVEMRQLMSSLSIDFLVRCMFGIKVDNPDDPNNYFIKLLKELSGNDVEFDFLYNLSLTFPFLTKFAPTLNNNASSQLASTVRAVLQNRRELPDTAKSQELPDKFKFMCDQVSSKEFKALGITQNTIDGQTVSSILASYDSIVTIMTMFLYYISTHPEAEERLMEEIDSFFAKHSPDTVEPDNLRELEFLHACLNETLRLVPPFIRPERVCTKDWEYNGICIPKGMTVMLPAWAYHRHPDLYPDDPDDFRPERFLSDAKSEYSSLSLATFGFGPRNCIGMKMAVECMKMCLAQLLHKFQFKSRSDTKITFKNGVLFLIMYDAIYLDVFRRQR